MMTTEVMRKRRTEDDSVEMVVMMMMMMMMMMMTGVGDVRLYLHAGGPECGQTGRCSQTHALQRQL